MNKKTMSILVGISLVIVVLIMWGVPRPKIKDQSVFLCETSNAHLIYSNSRYYEITNEGKIGVAQMKHHLNGTYSILADETISVTLHGDQIRIGSGDSQEVCTLEGVYSNQSNAEIQNRILNQIIKDFKAQIVDHQNNPDQNTQTELKDGSFIGSIELINLKIQRILETIETNKTLY